MADLSAMGLDPDVKEQGDGFTVIPEGNYKTVIVGDAIRDTSTGGKMLELSIQIIEGQFAGEKITDRLNIVNKSKVAQEIGQGQLKRLCTLTGVPFPPKNTAAMYGKPIMAKIVHEDFISNTTGSKLTSCKVKYYSAVEKTPAQTSNKPAAGAW